AGFPYPVLFLITVQQENGLYVHGLADTARWLSAFDTTQCGLLVNDVWKTILEYHQEDTTLPANPDVKQTMPGFMVTEVSDVGISVVLTMDYSSSMGDSISVAENAAIDFVRQMGVNDRCAVVKFRKMPEVFQDFTSDTTLLIQAIRRKFTEHDGTGLYSAILQSITQCLNESNRKAVIVYTDGQNNSGGASIDDVIKYANKNNVAVFTIGLMNANKDVLRKIANETGGLFSYAPNAEDLKSIYFDIYNIVTAYYVLAYTSPDPVFNGTWRTIDLTIDYNGMIGRGIGNYLAPYTPPDVSVSKKIVTDSISVLNSDTLHFGTPGDTVSYEIYVTNHGPTKAYNVKVVDIPPDSLFPIDFETLPDTVIQDSVVWQISKIEVGETVRIGYYSLLDTLKFSRVVALTNKVSAECAPDTFLINNTDSATVYFVPLLPPDVSITKQAIGDSLVVSHGDSTWYVSPGDTIVCKVLLKNSGEMDAHNITLTDILPSGVTLTHFSGSSFSQNGDTLSWTVSKLIGHGGEMEFNYSCRVDTLVPPWDVPLANTITVQCSEDTIPGNNSAQDTVWIAGVYPPAPKVRVSPSVIVPGDTVSIEVITPVSVKNWDIKIFFEDGSSVDTYGDEFIQTTPLAPLVWTRIVPPFEDTWMRTNGKEEKVRVVFQTVDFWDIVQSDTAYFLVRSSDEFLLDENVFRIASDDVLGMRFKLSSNRAARIVIYDIAGGFVKEIVNGQFKAGWNFTTWNGRNKNDQLVGSGIYVAILTSGNFKKARKFILVR
ncbi:MAG: hypothetical protein DRP89_05520, partial [Candidatus Neomarinimicrobiota bacterium]